MSILKRAPLYYDPYERCDLCFGIEIAMCLQSFRTGLRCLFAVQNLEKLRYLRNATVGKVSGSDCDVCRQFLIWKKMQSFHNGTDKGFTLQTNCDVLAVLFGTE